MMIWCFVFSVLSLFLVRGSLWVVEVICVACVANCCCCLGSLWLSAPLYGCAASAAPAFRLSV